MAEIKARCPDCGSEHYLRRGTVITSRTNGRRVKAHATGDWNECFCGCMFLALADGVRKIRSGQPVAASQAPPDGKPAVVAGLPPEDHRPRPAMPKARA